MSYPIISLSEPDEEKVGKLGIQVAELLREGKNFATAMSSVLDNRYGGKFKAMRSKVARFLQIHSTASRMKGKQLELHLS